jgi:hypothetical protein
MGSKLGTRKVALVPKHAKIAKTINLAFSIANERE